MAFGFFKKKNFADVIYMNGNIYTQDPALPWTSAVACKDGRIMAVGDFEYMEEINGSDTQVVDLEGKYMFPGFIDAHSSTVLQIFKDTYLEADSTWDLDTFLGELTNYCDNLPEGETAFAYGFSDSLFDDYPTPEEKRQLLDDIETDRPIVVLAASGINMLLNTVASEIVKTICEDNDIEYATIDFVLDALEVFDPEEIGANFDEEQERLTDKGFTSVFNYGSPHYFDAFYKNIMLEKIGDSRPIRQRFFGSYFINRPLNPTFLLPALEHERTFCTELEGQMNYNCLKIEACEDEKLSYFSQEALEKICLAVADKGFNIHIDALDEDTLRKAYKAFGLVKSKGYSHNNLVIATDVKIPQEEIEDIDGLDTINVTYGSDHLNNSVYGHSVNVEDAIDKLTIEAAKIIGEEDNLGSIQSGKLADFTVFDENIFDYNLKTFAKAHAEMIISSGEILYDAEDENRDEICDMLFNMQM